MGSWDEETHDGNDQGTLKSDRSRHKGALRSDGREPGFNGRQKAPRGDCIPESWLSRCCHGIKILERTADVRFLFACLSGLRVNQAFALLFMVTLPLSTNPCSPLTAFCGSVSLQFVPQGFICKILNNDHVIHIIRRQDATMTANRWLEIASYKQASRVSLFFGARKKTCKGYFGGIGAVIKTRPFKRKLHSLPMCWTIKLIAACNRYCVLSRTGLQSPSHTLIRESWLKCILLMQDIIEMMQDRIAVFNLSISESVPQMLCWISSWHARLLVLFFVHVTHCGYATFKSNLTFYGIFARTPHMSVSGLPTNTSDPFSLVGWLSYK